MFKRMQSKKIKTNHKKKTHENRGGALRKGKKEKKEKYGYRDPKRGNIYGKKFSIKRWADYTPCPVDTIRKEGIEKTH